MYLTYDEYVQLGGTLDEPAFADLEFEARSVVDWWTFNRLQNETEFPEAVKRCIYKLINLISAKQTAQLLDNSDDENGIRSKAGILSTSNDGVSVAYNIASANDIIDNSQAEIENTIRRYLNGVKNSLGRKVLYRGIYPDE